jgi:hypothetical protein
MMLRDCSSAENIEATVKEERQLIKICENVGKQGEDYVGTHWETGTTYIVYFGAFSDLDTPGVLGLSLYVYSALTPVQ